MNKENRKTVESMINKLEELQDIFENIGNLDRFNDVIYILEELESEENDKFQNMNEGLQQTPIGIDIQTAGDCLSECCGILNELELHLIQEKIDDVIGKLSNIIE